MSCFTPASNVSPARNVAVQNGAVRRSRHEGGRTSALLMGVVVTVTLMAVSTGASADSLAQREACTPDVFRLCSDYIPDRVSIVQCLTRNNDRLSWACRAVFAGKLK